MGFLGSLFQNFGKTFGGIGKSTGNLFSGFSSPSSGRQVATAMGRPVTYGQTMPSKQFQGTQSQGGMSNLFANLFNPSTQTGQIGLGLASNLFGQFAGPKTPKMPDIGNIPSVQAMRQFNPTSFKPLDPNLESAVNRGLDIEHEQQKKNLRDIYKTARPGTDYTTDSAYQRDLANLQRNQSLSRADALAEANSNWMRTQIGANEQEFSRLQQLANYDIESIMTKLGLDYAGAQKFKDTFSEIGDEFLSRGLGAFNLSRLGGV